MISLPLIFLGALTLGFAMRNAIWCGCFVVVHGKHHRQTRNLAWAAIGLGALAPIFWMAAGWVMAQ